MGLRNRKLLLAGIALACLSACSKIPGWPQAEESEKPERAALAGSTEGVATAAAAAAPDFGDDSGRYAKDGECDDMRFTGAGMTTTQLLDSDIKHDATDCRAAFNQGRLTFKGDDVTSANLANVDAAQVNRIQWGDDSGRYANDGECDDMRFSGAGMTATELLEADVKHDATDCRAAFQQGRLALRE